MVTRLLKLLQGKPRDPDQAQGHRVLQIRFLCDQDGPPERRAKEQWSLILQADRNVEAAFLVRVSLDRSTEQTVVLAVRRTGGPYLALIKALGDVFRGIFVKDVFVDIIFISEQQELQARVVAKPFYVLGGAS